MRKHIQGIDHAVIAARDLDAAQAAFGRMGFTLTPRGYHSLGSQNHCVMFGHDYLELLAVPTVHPANQYYAEFLAAGDGLAAIALATDSARGLYTEWLWAGLAPSDPVEFSRPVQLPEGTREAAFRISQLPPDRTPGGRLFCCEHFTRELVWRPEYETHANGVLGLAAVALIAEDVQGAARAYERVFDVSATDVPEGVLIETGGAPIAILTERAFSHRFPGIWMSGREAPTLGALFLRVRDREATRRVLEAGGFEPKRMPDGSYGLGAEAAHGLAMLFG